MPKLPTDPEALYALAGEHFQAGDFRSCIRCLSKLLSFKDYRLKSLTNTGACLYQLGHLRAAKKFLDRGIKLCPDDVFCQLNLAKTLFALKDFKAASHYFRRVLVSRPGDASSWRGLLESSASLLEPDACLSIAQDWSLALPDDEEAYYAQVDILQRLHRDADAVRLLQRCKDNISDLKRYNNKLLALLISLDMLEEALSIVSQAIAKDPLQLSYHVHKGVVEMRLFRTEECCASFQKAHSLYPSSAAFFLNQYLLPAIPTSVDDIKLCRDRFIEGLSLAEKNTDLEMLLEHPFLPHTFSLAYNNQNDKLLLERYHRLLKCLSAPILSRIKDTRTARAAASADDTRIRIGFMSRYFYNHSNFLAFEGIIRHLDRTRFQVVLINLEGVKKDDDHMSLCSACDEVIYLNDDLCYIYNKLHDLGLDILFFTDLGMTPYDFFYPMFRSAPVQVTGWGIPHTSGMSDVDYYISAQNIEPDTSESLYTEELVKLPGGLPCCFLADISETPNVQREYFFLPAHAPLVGCLQSLHKLHPDFDLILEDIAIKNPDAIFVFVEHKHKDCMERFLNRLERNAPCAWGRSLFLKSMYRKEYQALCSCMDLLLDPIYYGSGITFFEASLAGAIIVTLEGKFLRSRTVASGYREMELANPPIATTQLEYVEIVTSLLDNAEERKKLKAEILAKRERIFNRLDYVRNFEDFCINAVKR